MIPGTVRILKKIKRQYLCARAVDTEDNLLVTSCFLCLAHFNVLFSLLFGITLICKPSSQGCNTILIWWLIQKCSQAFIDALQQQGAKADLFLYEGKTHTDLFLQVVIVPKVLFGFSLFSDSIIILNKAQSCGRPLLFLVSSDKSIHQTQNCFSVIN
jgi:hypothetical protein